MEAASIALTDSWTRRWLGESDGARRMAVRALNRVMVRGRTNATSWFRQGSSQMNFAAPAQRLCAGYVAGLAVHTMAAPPLNNSMPASLRAIRRNAYSEAADSVDAQPYGTLPGFTPLSQSR